MKSKTVWELSVRILDQGGRARPESLGIEEGLL